MSVVRFSCPQLFDTALRTIHHPVDEVGVGVGRYLGRDPDGQSHESGGQGFPEPEAPLEARKADLDLLPYSRPSGAGFVGNQRDPRLSQLLLKLAASVGQISEQLAGYLASEIRLGEQLFGQGGIGWMGGGE